MTTTKGTPDGSQRHIQIILQRCGAGTILAILSILFLMGAVRAQAQPYAYVANFRSSSVSVIDTSTNTVTASPGC